MEASKIFYVIEKETQTTDCIEECTGWKNIWAYTINDNQPKLLCQIQARNDDDTVSELQQWLDENNFTDEYEFDQL